MSPVPQLQAMPRTDRFLVGGSGCDPSLIEAFVAEDVNIPMALGTNATVRSGGLGFGPAGALPADAASGLRSGRGVPE
jgi:hypothetical protein